MRSWCLVLVLLGASLLAVTPARASMTLGQLYDTYAFSSFPDLSQLERPDVRQRRFPDHEAGALTLVEYGEIDYYRTGLLGVITWTAQRNGFAATIYYGSDGFSRIMHQGLPLRAQQQITLSGRLPAGVRGVTLLLLWDEVPDPEVLARLAQAPNDPDLAVPAVREARWLPQRDASVYEEPWRDPFRPLEFWDKATAQEPWPWCSARLTAASLSVCKDCAVEFSGFTGLGYDDFGSYGQWRLDWGSELALYFELPATEDWDDVELLLRGSIPQLGTQVDISMLELEINGWPVRLRRSQLAASADMQHVDLALSQYLHGGSNRIKMRLSSLASSEWLIHGIEVWVY